MADILVIHNSGSGAAAQLDAAKQAFAAHHVEPKYVDVGDKNIKKRLDALHKNKGAIVVAAGGDGTINSVVQHLHDADTPLGIIPLGTLNHFAKALNVPLEIDKAVRSIMHGNKRRVDIGIVNDRVFINNSSIGFYPSSLRTREAYHQRIGKWPAAALGIAKAIARPRRYRLHITIDGHEQTFRTPFVFIGNNAYKRTPPNLGERTQLDSGELAVYIIKATRTLGIIRSLFHALITKKRRTRDFAVYHTQQCIIQTRHSKRVDVALDGEVMRLNAPLHYQSLPASLTVIVPRSGGKKAA